MKIEFQNVGRVERSETHRTERTLRGIAVVLAVSLAAGCGGADDAAAEPADAGTVQVEDASHPEEQRDNSSLTRGLPPDVAARVQHLSDHIDTVHAEMTVKEAELIAKLRQKHLELAKETSNLNVPYDQVQQGDARGMITLGLMYARGWNTAKDYARAAEWLKKAVDAGQDIAAYFLAEVLSDEKNPGRDDAEANRWFLHAAEAGDAQAMAMLGFRSTKGLGLGGPNKSEGDEWFRRAARLENASARTVLLSRHLPLLPMAPQLQLSEAREKELIALCDAALQKVDVKDRKTIKALAAVGRRFQSLPQYENGVLCQFTNSVLGGQPYRVQTFVVVGNEAVVLDGRSEQLHQLHQKVDLKLDTAEQVAAHLWLFNRAIQADYGTFAIVEWGELLPWSWNAKPEMIREIAPKVKPMTVRAGEKGQWLATATLHYGSSLVQAEYRVHPDGRVEMPSDTPIAGNLPLLMEKYDQAERILAEMPSSK